MRFLTYIFFLLFSLCIVGKTNVINFLKKIISPIEFTFKTEPDREAKGFDKGDKKSSGKEELKEKDSYYIESNFICAMSAFNNCNKHILNFYTLLFKSNFTEITTPPPELV